MRLLTAVKMESYKSFNRASTRLLGLFIALPLFYGIGNIKNSQAVSIEGDFSAITFGSMCWGLLGLTGITNILFMILIANYFGKEKEEGQIKFILLEICSRKTVIRAKYVSILLLMVFSYILMYAASIAVYYGCIAGPVHGSVMIDGFEDFLICFSTDFLYLIQLIMIASIEVLLCMYCKSSSISLLLGIALSLGFIVLQYVPIARFADPMYIVDLFNNSQISTSGVVIYGIIYLGICGILFALAEKKFEKVEIK